MTDQDIKTHNKTVATYMGWQYFPDNREVKYYSDSSLMRDPHYEVTPVWLLNPTPEYLKNKISRGYDGIKPFEDYCRSEDCRAFVYYESWDKLIPVYKKWYSDILASIEQAKKLPELKRGVVIMDKVQYPSIIEAIASSCILHMTSFNRGVLNGDILESIRAIVSGIEALKRVGGILQAAEVHFRN